MRFTIAVKDKKRFSSFLSLVKTEYLDCFVSGNYLMFVSNSFKYFAQYFEPIIERNETTTTSSFRIKKEDLSNLLDEGMIEFIIDDEYVKVNFYDKGKNFRCGIKFITQIVDVNGYSDRMQLLANIHSYSLHNLSELKQLARIARILNTDVCIYEGYAFVSEKNIKCFKKTTLPNLTVEGDLLRRLLALSTNLYLAGNYLGYFDNNLGLLVNKFKCKEVNDYEIIVRKKPKQKVTLSLVSLMSLFAKIKHVEGLIEIKLSERKAIYSTDTLSYEVPIVVKDVQSIYSRKAMLTADLEQDDLDINLEEEIDLDGLLDVDEFSVHKIEKILFPSYVVSKILTIPGIDLANIELLIYQECYIIKLKSFSILFGRSRDANVE